MQEMIYLMLYLNSINKDAFNKAKTQFKINNVFYLWLKYFWTKHLWSINITTDIIFYKSKLTMQSNVHSLFQRANR